MIPTDLELSFNKRHFTSITPIIDGHLNIAESSWVGPSYINSYTFPTIVPLLHSGFSPRISLIRMSRLKFAKVEEYFKNETRG